MMKQFNTVDEYFAALPKKARERCESLRKIILRAAPKATEVIHYNIPAFERDGILVWYAGFKKHLGFYPRASAIAAFRSQLKAYKTSKGAIQFPMEKEIPAGLIRKMVKFRLKENAQEKKQATKRR